MILTLVIVGCAVRPGVRDCWNDLPTIQAIMGITTTDPTLPTVELWRW